MFKWIMLFVDVLLSTYVLGHLLFSFNMIKERRWKTSAVLVICFLFLSSAMFLGKVLPQSTVSLFFLKLGNYWIGLFIYFIFFFVVADIFLVIRKIVRLAKKKKPCVLQTKREGYILAGLVISCSLVFTIYGAIHMRRIRTTDYDIIVDKDGGKIKDLNMVLIADLHLGYSVGCKDMEKMVKRINEETPDIVILAGDIFDNNYDALDDPEQLAEIFRGIKSRMGVYAVFGNHDVKETLIGGFSISSSANAFRDERMKSFMEKSGFTVLEDAAVLLKDSFYLIGRLDGEKPGYGSAPRESLSELTTALDKEKPLFVINHEPDHLSEYAKYGVDVLLSGHTHGGQFFPLTIVQPFAWENYWGMKKVKDMYSVVTSGVGVYGPPLRVFTDSEIAKITIHFK